MRQTLIVFCGLSLLVSGSLWADLETPRAVTELGPVVTSQGLVQGVPNKEGVAYLGLEYARAGRWETAGPGPTWDGVRTLDSFGPACPQDGLDELIEDCLFLNVFTPQDTPPGARLPVLFWIHGGGFRAGRGGEGPSAFVQHDVVVVTFNYRLGVLGFHDWAGWSEDDPRNFGQGDMLSALQWVNKNIAAFGGDSNNITLAGHSAGGMGVQLMMVDPRAKGLFARAISDAGYGTWPFPKAANPSAELRERMRIRALELDASPAALVARTPHFHLPYVGGSDLRRQPIETFERGEQAAVPYMSGGNSYDGLGVLEGAGFQADSYVARYADEKRLVEAYADDLAVSSAQAAARLFGDMRYVFAAWSTTRNMWRVGQPGYLFYYAEMFPGHPGSPHGAHYQRAMAGSGSDLEAYWLAFIRDGKPTGDGLPTWPSQSTDADPWMVFDPAAQLVDGALSEKMKLIENLEFPVAK